MKNTQTIALAVVASVVTILIVIQSLPNEKLDLPQWLMNYVNWKSNVENSDSNYISGVKYLVEKNMFDISFKKISEEAKIEPKPTTNISNSTINWNFKDSKDNSYSWSMSNTGYDYTIKKPLPEQYLELQLPNGTMETMRDYRQFVEPDFKNVIDQVYNNAGSDDQFLFEVWYIVSRMTTYSEDITESNLWPLETFSRGVGDCKDTSILLASMIRSSEHTKNWKVKLVYLDLDNPTNPKNINHIIVEVNTDHNHYVIESTAKDYNGLTAWEGVNFFGWRFDV